MDYYMWESGSDIQDVIDKLIVSTEKQGILKRMFSDYKGFSYKLISSGGYKFTLWFNYRSSGRYSYTPASLIGEIVRTGKGCRTEAHFLRWPETVDILTVTALTAVFCACAVSALFTGDRYSGAICAVFCVLATAILTRFLYTRGKWKTKSESILLDIIDHATAAERQHMQ